MTVHSLPRRPTVSNPVIKNDQIASALSEIDDQLRYLKCAADSAALAEVDGELPETLYSLHKSLTFQLSRLYALT